MTFYMSYLVVLNRFLKLTLNSFLSQSVERFVILLKLLVRAFFLHMLSNLASIYKDCIYRAINYNAGISPEAARRLSPFYSYCFC